MALIYFTTEEVREKISRAIRVYEPRVQKAHERKKKRIKEHRKRHEKEKASYESELKSWEDNKEATIKKRVEEELREQEIIWWRAKRTRAEIEITVKATTIFVGRPHYPRYSPLLWPHFEISYAERAMSFCLQLRDSIVNYDSERLVGLTLDEVGMLDPVQP